MQETARRIAKVSQESRLPVNEDEYVAGFKVELMDAVMQWCRGAKFAEICKVCGRQETRSSSCAPH
jgi:ATP-dependent RNA helicase DOB1